MVETASNDQLDPALRLDLFFGDVAAVRRQVQVSGAIAAGLILVGTARFFLGDYPSWLALLSLVSNALIIFVLVVGGAWRQDSSALLVSGGERVRWRGLRALDQLLAEAKLDPELAADRRLPGEVAKARRLRTFAWGIVVAIVAVTAFAGVVAVRAYPSPLRAVLSPARPSTIELVDVLIMPASADFHSLISVDITRGQVTQIAPYVTQRSGRVPELRAFEAVGKFLVAGDAIDFSKPGWLDQFKRSWMKPIDIGTSGDFLVVDVDPRTHDIRQDQIAGAVVGGKYYSRQEIRATGR